MKKLTVQDLAMFIGCEMQSGRFIGVLNKVSDSGYGVTCSSWWEDDTSKYKLLLRTLSDMTDEEALDLFNHSFKCMGVVEDGDNLGYKVGYLHKNEAIIKGRYRLEEGTYKPEALKYLISKHFDVFGWIEKGLALDKTKL